MQLQTVVQTDGQVNRIAAACTDVQQKLSVFPLF